MSTSKWFGRKFDFSFGPDEYTSIYLRLQQAPDILAQLLTGISEHILTHQPDGKWSVKEHTGHLSVLEPLWRTRMHDILEQKPVLTATDLENKATSEAGFNKDAITALLEKFLAERRATVELLDSINVPGNGQTSMHPRLQQPMRIIDIAYFTAEHDDHHIAVIRELVKGR
jgi:uncharacterized damage-inducible protein DinB